MTLCELEIAHLSPPMECRSAKQKTAATPADRRHCVEWVLHLSTHLHPIMTPGFRALARSAQSWSSYSGYFRESSELRFIRSFGCITHGNSSSHVLCLPAAERYRYPWRPFHMRVPETYACPQISQRTSTGISRRRGCVWSSSYSGGSKAFKSMVSNCQDPSR